MPTAAPITSAFFTSASAACGRGCFVRSSSAPRRKAACRTSFATLTANGVHLREAALTPQGEPQGAFEIDYVQMPRLAALLDFLHNALGFTVVADLLAPLLPKTGAPKSTADEVARALQAALNAWLSERLESNNHILQAQQIRGFIASRGRLAPETVDDEAILLFWIQAAEADKAKRIEGFRLYRGVAAAMLRYRQALRDALAARYLEEALGRGLEPANERFHQRSGRFAGRAVAVAAAGADPAAGRAT